MAEIALSAAAGLLKLVLILLAVLVVLGVILLCIRMRLILHSERGVLKVWLAVGPFRISPDRLEGVLKKAPKENAPKKKSKKQKKPADKPKPKPKPQMQTADAVELMLSLLEDLRGLVDFPVLRLDAVIASGDPARTGILVGQAAVLISNLYPWLVSGFSIKNPHIWIDGDFESGHKTQWVFDLEAKTRLIRALRFLIKRQSDVIRLGRWARTISS